jgi:hypothetical protein
VGHRPHRLAQADLVKLATVIHNGMKAVKKEVHFMYEASKAFYTSVAPVVRAISPLAEGTDRIFAEQALGLNFELCCVMPFAQAEFEKDFAAGKTLETNSLARFRNLRDQARTHYELDGSRLDEGGAYATAGLVVLNQSDLLVVVWDGERQGKRGGTEETFDEARRRGLPILWIDAHAPHGWRLLDAATPLPKAVDGKRLTPGESNDLEPLHKCVREGLAIPKLPKQAHAGADRKAKDPQHCLENFYKEHQPSANVAVVWKAFRDIVADGKVPQVEFSVTPFEKAVEKEWPRDQLSPIARQVDYLRPFYAWPDKLAGIYSDRHRSAFVLSFLLAGLAVVMALLPVGLLLPKEAWATMTCNGLELAFILVILGLVLRGRHQRWHERWLEYRLTAELVRHLRLVAPLGGTRPFPQIPAHWSTYGQPGVTWMAWYVRAVERAIGLPTTLVDKAHLEACFLHMTDLLVKQVEFHKTNAKRCHLIERRLHRSGIILLLFTLFCCIMHFLPMLWSYMAHRDRLFALLPFFCGVSPALGAALAGINNQGEFRRIAKRSEAMKEQLELLLGRIESLRDKHLAAPVPSPEQFSPLAAALAGDAARLLINEVLDWRVVLLDRPLIPPA